jgi:hypothetical protein
LPHFVHRAERDAAVRLLERREVAADLHLLRLARLAELARRPLQVDEDAVGVGVGTLEPHVPERLKREVAHACVLGPLGVDVRGVLERRDAGGRRERIDAAQAPGA